MTEDTNKFKVNHKFILKKSFLSYPVTEFYHITMTFGDSLASSKQVKWKLYNDSSVSVPCLRHRTDT